jgi:predicted metal-binding membrane protein
MRSFVDQREARPAPARRVVPGAIPVSILVAWADLLLAELLGAPIAHDALAAGSVPLVVALAVFGVAWAAMVLAMMLPSSYPAIRAFAATLPDSPGRAANATTFVVGYVAVWVLFGFCLFTADLGIHAVVDGSPTPGAAHAALTGDALLVAGAFQLTERKRRCLSRCRHPVAPPGAAGAPAGVGAESRGSAGPLQLGFASGLDCLGACWALMLAVFALGSPQVAWMALFGSLMAYEKTGRHGVTAARLAGAALLAASVLARFSIG